MAVHTRTAQPAYLHRGEQRRLRLTKGQFSATADLGLELKGQGTNPYMPVDIAWEALVANATF
jgi:hypothetical protein